MRTTDDPKESTLKLRLNADMKAHVESTARRLGISVSEYLRNLIESDMTSSKILKNLKRD